MATKKYLTELINYCKDIKPYKNILIKAPVGSGKNHFMGQLALNEIEGADNPAVLLITSRRGTVDQTLNDDALLAVFAKCKGLKYDQGQLWQSYQLAAVPDGGERYCREDKRHSCVMTMAKMASIYDRLYQDSPEAWGEFCLWPWMFFDVVVLDEVHALVRDSGFSSYGSHILDMIEHFSKAQTPEDKKLIMMSATPECVLPILTKKLGDIKTLNYPGAERVLPNAVLWTTSAVKARQEIIDKVRNGEKVIYFYDGYRKTVDEFLGLSNEDLFKKSVSIFSADPEELKRLKQDNAVAWHNITRTLDEIATKGRLPDDIYLVIVTAKWREGLNIKNKDIKWVYMDTHIVSDVVQYSGRVRRAKYTLVINRETENHRKDLNKRQVKFWEDIAQISALNKEYHALQSPDDCQKMRQDIEKPSLFIDGKSQENEDFRGLEGIHFNYFSGNFEANDLMQEDIDYCLECIDRWQSLDKSSDTSYSDYIRGIFDNKLKNVRKVVFKEHQAALIFSRMKFKPGETYTEKKILTLKDKLKSLFRYEKDDYYINTLMYRWQMQRWIRDSVYFFETIKHKGTEKEGYLLHYEPKEKKPRKRK